MASFSPQAFAKRHRSLLAPLVRLRERLETLALVHEPEGGGPLGRRLAGLTALARRLEDRCEWGGEAPVIAAVLGATGTGKSKLFNTLVGRPLSPSGFKRPTTLAPVLYLSQSRLDGALRPAFLPDYLKKTASDGVRFDAAAREVILVPDPRADVETLLLIDTPDFDSVLARNRAAARDVYDRCDAVVFVTDAIKYADQAAWDYLDLIKARGKRSILVVNRVKNPLSIEDFSG
ncbi:MAG: GTPase domain-containing protein, partial [Proteobacteria bacterium]|nr:GTPase domain-containing protein [Pseudomonadota bacterium]